MISEYFKEIFTSNGNMSFTQLHDLLTCKVTPEMNQILTTIPSDSEIAEAAVLIIGGKTRGSDGFSTLFYQSYWHII